MDWNLPTIAGTTYVNWNTQLKDRDLEVAKMLDSAVVSVTNPVTDMKRWNPANNYWEKYNGTTWVALTSTYAIAISGNAGTASTWATPRQISLTGAVTGSQTFDGSANFSVATTYTTVPVDKGGTNLTSYTIGDLIYASGATTLSKLADIATGNALISGGVGAAPSWGKINLTTHVSGLLPIANGGTNAANITDAKTNLGLVIGADVQAFDADLSAIAGLASNGMIVRTGAGTAAVRSIAGTANRIVVTANADGVSGNPTLDVGSFVAKQRTQTLTDATTILWNMNNGNVVKVTLGGNRTLDFPSGTIEAGSSGFIDVIQDATGGRTLAFHANYRFVAGVDPVITSTANARDRLYWSTFDGTTIDITQTVDMKT